MGGADWQRTRAKARAAAGEVAEELVQLYRRRLAVEGHAFGPDTPWQTEMESSFEFVETEDQLKAIADVKADMEEPRPMDRLICGDVGFGKTEVAGAGRLQGGAGRHAGRRSGPDDAAGQPARPDLRRSLRALPGPGRAAQPLPVAGAAEGRSSRDWPTAASTWSSAPTGCWRRTSVQASSASWWSTRSSASASRTRRR